MRFLVAGQGKSGTSALFFKIRNSLGPEYRALFEPREYVDRGPEPLVAKIVVNDPTLVRVADFDRFERKVLIVRDPRDNLISRLLYALYNFDVCAEPDRVSPFVRLLKTKEGNPASVTVLELFDELRRITGVDLLARYLAHQSNAIAYHDARSELYVFRYEQLIGGDTSALGSYLGLSLTGRADVDHRYARVARTKAAGGWVHWFTRTDVDRFRPLLREYMARYRYVEDWTLPDAPILDAAQSSEYVMRLVEEKRGKLAAR